MNFEKLVDVATDLISELSVPVRHKNVKVLFAAPDLSTNKITTTYPIKDVQLRMNVDGYELVFTHE